MENIPPFYVGEEVICVDGKCEYKTGEKYTVRVQFRCPKCGVWYIGCLPHGQSHTKFTCTCKQFCNENSGLLMAMVFARRFSKIKENFQSISLSKVLEEETKLISVN